MTLAIIDSGGANISSVKHALRRLGAEPVFTSDAATIKAAERVILPGVGAAGAAMSRLRELDLVDCIRGLKQPVLGICLGMQLLFEQSQEDEVVCLGVIPGKLRKLQAKDGVRVPHMGWNTTTVVREDRIWAGTQPLSCVKTLCSTAYRQIPGTTLYIATSRQQVTTPWLLVPMALRLQRSWVKRIFTVPSFTPSDPPGTVHVYWQTFWNYYEQDGHETHSCHRSAGWSLCALAAR